MVFIEYEPARKCSDSLLLWKTLRCVCVGMQFYDYFYLYYEITITAPIHEPPNTLCFKLLAQKTFKRLFTMKKSGWFYETHTLCTSVWHLWLSPLLIFSLETFPGCGSVLPISSLSSHFILQLQQLTHNTLTTFTRQTTPHLIVFQKNSIVGCGCGIPQLNAQRTCSCT